MRADVTVAEYNMTGIATSPNEIVREAIERAGMDIDLPTGQKKYKSPRSDRDS
jgi:hypothetical protein